MTSGERRSRRADRFAVALLLAQSAAVVAVVAPVLGRALWYNEQWRAWQATAASPADVVDGNPHAPLALGWVLLVRASAAVFGTTEVALRLPGVLSLPLLAWCAYRLARRWLGPLAAYLTVAALLSARMVMTYTTELAPYTVEAAATAAALLLWTSAREASAAGCAARYAAIALLALVATPLVFVLAPLLLLDAVRALRSRRPAALAAPVAVGAVTAAHLLFYVRPQATMARSGFWADYAPAGRSPGEMLAFAARRLWELPIEALTRVPTFSTAADPPLPLSGPTRPVLHLLAAAALATGLVAAARAPRARPLLAVALGIPLGMLAASVLGMWAFGFTRVNTFALPVGYLVGALGVASWVRARPRAGAVAGVTAAALVVVAVGGVSVRQADRAREAARAAAFGYEMPELVEHVRPRMAPGDVAVVLHPMAVEGWDWYMRVREGAQPAIPWEQTMFLDWTPRYDEVAGFLARHRDARHVYVVLLAGTQPARIERVMAMLADAGYVRSGDWRRDRTGAVWEMTRGA